jgi:dTDP-4-dehydrorhamnose 3,5-epimerase
MKLIESSLKDAYIIEPEPCQDHRGMFTRIFCEKELQKIGHEKRIVQINHSLTRRKGALRGIHYQRPPKGETKIITCLRGSVFDVMVDLREGSSTLFKWQGEILSEKNQKIIYVPEGFAHGFQTMEEECELLYLHTEFYSPEFEGGVRWDDPVVKVAWPLPIKEISERDRSFPLLSSDFKGLPAR